MLMPSGNPFKCHEEVLSLQPMIPPKRFDIFPPDWGILGRSRRSDFNIVMFLVFLDMYVVCIYGHTFSKSMDQPGKVANPTRGQLNRENEYFPGRVRA